MGHLHLRHCCGPSFVFAVNERHNHRMNSGDYLYIWQAPDWPHWRYDLAALAEPMARVSHAQGLLLGRLADVGLGLRDEASLAALTDDVLKTSEIVGDLLLARADGSPQRFYSLSAQIQRERKAYYDMLERTQKGTLEITAWLLWFFQMLGEAVSQAHGMLDAVLVKARFWQRQQGAALNTRQIKVLNRLLDGFEGKLTTSKWATLAKCSSDTALRDINELLEQGALQRSVSGGRSTSYELKVD